VAGVEVGPLFGGSAIGAVGAGGRLRLPPFVLATLRRRSDGRRIVFGAHESDPCLSACEPAGRAALLGRDGARRLFGFSEEAEFDSAGRVALPPILLWKGRIGGRALFVGTGNMFEIWNPDLALETGEPVLRELAEYRLEELRKSEREEGQ
jgi:transcriptional regulator MraZ